MGTGIALRPDSCWLPAGWVGRTAANQIVPELVGPFAVAVRKRVEHIHAYPGAVTSFEDASSDEVRTLYDAAVRGRASAERAGADGWERPDMFPGFLRAFDELLAYIASDARLSGSSDTEAAFPSSREFHVTFFSRSTGNA